MAAWSHNRSGVPAESSAHISNNTSMGLTRSPENQGCSHSPQSERSLQPNTLVLQSKGLKLKLEGKTSPFLTFTYALFPFMDECVPMDWKPLVNTENVQGQQHIRYHKLQDGDELSTLVANFRRQYAKALILINTQDNYSIAPPFLECLATSNFPIAVLSKSDGDKLLEVLGKDDDDCDILARLDVMDQDQDKNTSMKRIVVGSDQLSPAAYLESVLNGLMFSSDNTTMVVSNKQAKLVLVMATISSYEDEVDDANPDMSNILEICLKSHFEKNCIEDLPFYITVMYRFHSRKDIYHCDEFILSSLNTIERLKPMDLAATINKFLERGDFNVISGLHIVEETKVSMFCFMKKACLQLLEVSHNQKNEGSQQSRQKPLHPKFCYSRMMWLTLALKFHSKISQEIKEAANCWYAQFIDYFPQIDLVDQVIRDIKSGLELGKELNLPKGLSFDIKHMTDLVVPEKILCVRPFKHLLNFVDSIESFVSTEISLLTMLTNFRAMYTSQIDEPNFNPAKLNSEGTFVDTITEGIGFLDFLVSLWKRRNFEDETLRSECVQWLHLLINMVNIPDDHDGNFLGKFLSQRGVCKKYQHQVSKLIVSACRKCMWQLPIQQFFVLFRLSYKIWPKEFLQEYLSKCRLPEDLFVNAYKDFLSEIVNQFPEAHDHSFLVDLIKNISVIYYRKNCRSKFIFELMQLRVPKLLSGKSTDGNKNTRGNFAAFLRGYINSNVLNQLLFYQIPDILEAISEEKNFSEFQGIILNVLSRETVSKSEISQESKFLSILNYCIEPLKELSASLSTKETFCWGLVATCCTHIKVNSENLEWLHKYNDVLSQLLEIFSTYCIKRNFTEKQAEITQDLPQDIAEHSSEDVKSYFKWIQCMQTMFENWKVRMDNRDVNCDEIFMYASFNLNIERLCPILQSTRFVKSAETVEIKKNFLEKFELLNVYILKYIPQQPEAKYCNLLVLLKEYGVSLPEKLLSCIEKHIIFPDDQRRIGKEVLRNPVPSSINGKFQPSSNISLQLTKHISFKQLSELVTDLNEFHKPLSPVLDMLIFFKLNPSVVFSTYLRTKIKQKIEKEKANAESQYAAQSDTVLSTFSDSAFSIHDTMLLSTQNEVSVAVLRDSLLETKQLIIKLVKGEAPYVEITAGGSLDLEKLDIEREFATLQAFSSILNISQVGFEGLQRVCDLLELFQYVKHIQNIHDVCDQYHLQHCLQDEQLKEVFSLVNDVKIDDTISSVTPNIASERMKRIKLLLCIDTKEKSARLEVFPIVANCAELYMFICDKQFYGEKGQATFRQQYQLVTAQLQHEEYEESVLNHLLAAFNVISPFMDEGQSFNTLMRRVTSLDTKLFRSHQLETVSANITLIRLWFSKAEGDTLQNLEKELDKILEVGHYSFVLPIDEKIRMTLEFVPFTNEPSGIDENLSGTLSFSSAPSMLEPKIDSALKKEQWNSEQIGDFVRKLGFMDTEKEGGEKIKHFRHISAVAYRLLDLYGQLKDLGCPKYCNNEIISLPCQISHSDADNKVRETEKSLKNWKKNQVQFRNQYNLLLFFSMPKILHLYKLLSCENSSNEHLDKIVSEISFLRHNNEAARNCLRKSVQERLSNCLEEIQEGVPLMHVVGQFLHGLFDIPKFQFPRRSKLSPAHTYGLCDNFREVTRLLHYCPHFTQKQLIQTVIGIYSGVPEAFEVFHCQHSSTEEELKLFLCKAVCHSLHAVVLEVNKLPFCLQEDVMQLHVQNGKNHEKTSSELVTKKTSCVNFIETEPSVLRDVPWMLLKEHEVPSVSFEEAQKVCKEQVVHPSDFSCIELVVGAAGDGKTHYIKKQLQKCSAQITIAVNEAFTSLKAISKLCTLPNNQKHVSIFFNFTILPPEDSDEDQHELKKYKKLMEVIGWFFFDLLILGYVEDPATGKSFRIPGGLEWAIYIEVPSRGKDTSPEESIKDFYEEVPALGLLGTVHTVQADTPYTIDDDVQLVCKYLQAYDKGWIDRLHQDGGKLVKFSLEPNISPQDCQKLLKKHMSKYICRSKITQRLFIKYMKRRCEFLDNLPAFNYNTGFGEYKSKHELSNTRKLGSTLMRTMLAEVTNFCDATIMDKCPHQQLIYDYKDHGASFGFISLHPHKLSKEKDVLEKIGITIPSRVESYHTRDVLDELLSRALNLQLKDKRLTAIDDCAYVLTLDYTIKMLNIHERHECGVPVIIEGETGVGKTALVEMLSRLWSQSQLLEWEKQRGRIIEYFVRMISDIPEDISSNYEACFQTVKNLNSGEQVSKDCLLTLCKLPDGSHGQLYSHIHALLSPMRNDPVVAQLTLTETQFRENSSLEQLFDNADAKKSAEATATLLHAVICAEVKSTFYKINVHSAMTPADVEEHFKPVLNEAKKLRDSYLKIKASAKGKNSRAASVLSTTSTQEKKKSSDVKYTFLSKRKLPHLQEPTEKTEKKFMHRMPFVTVFLDEINTSSCLGFFKEIIVDRNIDGKQIPENVFIVAACNPHRGNSLASLGRHQELEDKWMRGTYYVRKLHPTLRFLMWDYGSLDEHQEKEYINAKMKMLNKDMSNPEVASLADLIVESQKQMRKYAYEQIKSISPSEFYAKASSRSCVSQRDIQRVFAFFQWFMRIYDNIKPHADCTDYNRRAVLVALAVVYYMRLNTNYRKEYVKFIDTVCRLPGDLSFIKAFNEELDWYINLIEIPKGIARTQALKENMFANIVCTATHTPLIIVGAPGSSKTLSFNLTIANLKGAESKVKTFRDKTIFHALDPHYYQCSRRTTSNEIQTVFSRAINRQKSHSQFNLPIYCVVFMDEAGLPEESHESLKILHYHLDKQEVSFVAISNHVLDAAKTNRAVSLFRPESSDKDLEILAKGCFCSNPENPPPELEIDLRAVVKFCKPYSALMSKKSFARFFGLRDFIQFVNYLRRKHDENHSISSQIVMQALERNFNGYIHDTFWSICNEFLQSKIENVQQRSVIDIFCASLKDRPQEKQDRGENEVRYKLIIDPSGDDSLVRLFFTFGILNRRRTRIFVCSNFPADGHLQKINTIAAIRHSAIEGHTVVMSQTDDIHESFYDLFNQRFRRIDDLKEGTSYYTNIAIGAHLRPSRVHPNFQCIVVVKKSEIVNTPSPFLNRFEKYLITHESMLDYALTQLPPNISVIIRAATNKVNDFVILISGVESLYGLTVDTLHSLIISLLPSADRVYPEIGELRQMDNPLDIKHYLLEEIVHVLREYTGLYIPKCSKDEFCQDIDAVFNLIVLESKFKSSVQNLNQLSVVKAIREAFYILHSDTALGKGEYPNMSPEACLVITVLQQWLVRHLCKRLMQLMTPEALILHRNKIPFSYLNNYLSFQTHFSLRKLVECYHQVSALTRSEPPSCHSATKVLCFTRSSPLIHQLPNEFQVSVDKSIDTQVLKNFIISDPGKLVLYKLSSFISQTTVQDLIKNFLDSKTTEVCLLIVNMQKISREIVNHIRIIIEEAEVLSRHQITKVFIVLLHFSPAQFFLRDPCYPSLFLKGWDHCYLDTIAHRAVKGTVDIRDWFWQCCFPRQLNSEKSEILQKTLYDMLPQAIPVIVSRVTFGSRKNVFFNCPMNGLKRADAVSKLFGLKGQNEITFGRVLCEKFRAYWKPSVMTEQLEKVAMFSKNRESTLNITEAIQINFRNLFIDFLVYFVARINENYNIDILFDPNCLPEVQQLFLEILKVFPTVKLSRVTLLSNNLTQPRPQDYTPKFPFFNFVFELMEKIVEQSREEANIKLDVLNEVNPSESNLSPTYIKDTLQKAILSRISEKMGDTNHKQVLDVVQQEISVHPELWNRYFHDFVLHKLQLDSDDSGGAIAQQMLRNTLLKDLHTLDALERLISLHTYVHVYQLDLAKMASMLRPLNNLKKLHKDISSAQSSSVLSPGPIKSPPQNLSIQTKHSFGSRKHLTTFVVSTLFDALVGFLYSSEDHMHVESIDSNTKIWYKVYRDMMTLPNLKHYIYSSLGDGPGEEMLTVEAKLNLMQTTFLTLQIKPNVDQKDEILVCGRQVFWTLFPQYFTESIELIADCPRLSDVVTVSLEVITSNRIEDDSESARIIIEGLLAHFFSPERQYYHSQDIDWFLYFANMRKRYKSYSLEDDCEVMSGVVFDSDFPSQQEESPPVFQTMSSSILWIFEEAVDMNVLKFYLGKILDPRFGNTDSGPLELYSQLSRNKIGVVLTSKEKLGSPGPFIPEFYKNCPFVRVKPDYENPCMQQPLAHIYFLTVLEHLMSKPYKFSGLIRFTSKISTLCGSDSTSDASKAVLFVEFQAILQVLAQQLAVHLDPTQPDKFSEVEPVLDDINRLMNDEATGGGEQGGHGMVVALTLYKLFKSSRQFVNMILKNYDSLFRGISCIKQFSEQTEFHSEFSAHLLPFMAPEVKADSMASLYNQVNKTMTAIHNGESVDSLKQLADECAPTKRRFTMSKAMPTNRRDWFRMMVWLVTYYEFFCRNVESKALHDAVGSPKLLPYLEENNVKIIQCFLMPDNMIHQKEALNMIPKDLPSTRQSKMQLTDELGDKKDFIYELFMPSNRDQQDQSDSDLCHSLANLVAVVMGCPAKSNHLWYHMFAPEQLVNFYMTGFMYNSKISPEGLQYDCGVELTAQGEFGRSDYLKHASRGTYTLHSLYLLLWSNFGAFTMSLLTQPDADAKIHGSIISENQPMIRHYCVSQLKAVWEHMKNNLGLSEEERTFFVNQCLKTFHEVMNGSQKIRDSHESAVLRNACNQGIFTTLHELDEYEKVWHLYIYQPTWNQLQNRLAAKYSSIQKNALFANIEYLDVLYPCFPSEVDFLHCVVSHGDLKQLSEGGELRTLSSFAYSWRILQAGGLLLPDLVEFYRWLHNELSHLLTYEKTIKISILRVVQLAAKRYGSSMGEYITALYERVKKGYNDYVELIGGAIGAGACAAVKQGNKIYTIADDVPLLHFLTDSEQEEEGNDWLFTMITHIVETHNMAIESLYSRRQSQDQFLLKRLLPDQPTKVLLTEISDKNCLLGKFTSLHGVSSLLQVIRSRCQPPSLKSDLKYSPVKSSALVKNEQPMFQLKYLEEDLLRLFYAGKPLIESPSSIRMLFKFNQISNLDKTLPDDVIRVTQDLEKIRSRLPEEYKKQLSVELHKHLEYEFHSCDYTTLIVVTTAFQNVCGHLNMVIMKDAYSLNKEDLVDLTLPKFLAKFVYDSLTDPQEVLAKVGIGPESLNQSQFACLTDLPLPSVFACLQLFVQWIDQGVYDFCSLPLALKAHFSESDSEFFEKELENQWKGTLNGLEVEIKQFIEVLKHSERNITKRVNKQAPRVSIIHYLAMYNLIECTDKLPSLIPDSVTLQHYVYFRLALRRLLIKLRAKLTDVYSGERQDNRWSEFVTDIWGAQLNILREDNDMSIGQYGFTKDTDSVSEEGSLFDIENVEVNDRSCTDCSVEKDNSMDINESVLDVGKMRAEKTREEKETEQPMQQQIIEESLQPISNIKRTQNEKDFIKKASDYTPDEVGDFLCSIKLDKYREAFVENEVSGADLLEADRATFSDLGVESLLDCLRIMTLFQRLQNMANPQFPVSTVLMVLKDNGLEKYAKHFEENQVDGDMILIGEEQRMKTVLKDEELMKSVLTEMGIEKGLDRTKIIGRFKKFASSQS